jgi:hypothetical protein
VRCPSAQQGKRKVWISREISGTYISHAFVPAVVHADGEKGVSTVSIQGIGKVFHGSSHVKVDILAVPPGSASALVGGDLEHAWKGAKGEESAFQHWSVKWKARKAESLPCSPPPPTTLGLQVDSCMANEAITE